MALCGFCVVKSKSFACKQIIGLLMILMLRVLPEALKVYTLGKTNKIFLRFSLSYLRIGFLKKIFQGCLVAFSRETVEL